jgi:hypothetical protein
MRRVARRQYLLVVAFLIALAGCGKPGAGPMPAISPLPNPKVPAWVEQISPTGEADNFAQIRVRFQQPLIPVEAIETPSQQAKLAYFSVTPALAGHFRFLTPRMVGFQADQALPIATRIKVVVHAGLTDLNNNTLAKDIAWTFTTPGISLDGLPTNDENSTPVSAQPTFEIQSNVELDQSSLAQHGSISAKGIAPVAITVKLQKQPTPGPNDDQSQQKFDPSQKPWIYEVSPSSALAHATTYSLQFSPGIMPAHGNLPSTDSYSGDFAVYGPLAFVQLSEQDYTGRFSGPPKQLEFNNPLNADSVAKNITLSPMPKGAPQIFHANDGDKHVYIAETPLDPATKYTITIGPGVKDSFGQTFGSSKTVSYTTGFLTPAVWVPPGFFIFPSGDNLQLDLWAINLPKSRFEQ